MIKTILQLAFCVLAGFVAFWWYGLVLPDAVAALMALLIAAFAGYSMLAGGLKIHRALLGGAVFAVWPAGSLLAQWVAGLARFPLSEAQALAAAWPVALLAAKASFAMSEKRDRARDLGNLSLGTIAVYTVLAAAWAGEPLAMAFAALGAATIAANAAQQMILPPQHERFLMGFAKAGGAACVLLVARWAILS